ncbi:peptide chain release factor N(5)-glutamine methyltransferase [Rathayibacter sp. AY1B7]|uniref:peptide chain release factor N(5)-glutamine methyltransferase n=1 Tax=unclassified Rathayibacter TaxID=2609250 RepID=UPI000CE9156A|nr:MULTISPECIES: peptide chain release factor N(5)-glutamine methyltransferase [unclassified Rathayibacter]PPF49234.1 peptide chain release factor N(5)-glutamine methyltransferase [Rathayibacter sp. AY1A1]PPG86794.1 peptide chain release factor N(5)-glutamine methyltransferase [Rathayibacter sp. AY1H2]PPH00529.1 peptide chain release factor N(5)-glutamine methyltransferase [Rathayibacter sp. AY1G9]PPI00820.1 peptide chain release factor N(5)-glutamine methyltransferase [Rathayibacter sp. AY1B7]
MTLVTTGVDARTLLADAVARLAAARVPTPDVDAELLLGHLLGLGRGRLQARLITGLTVDDEHAAAFASVIERRSAREPLQHITGIAPFRSLELAVGPGVFVPRPETEGVAQIAIDALRAVVDPEPIAVDLGTGSGALALALAHEVPHARVIGVENAPEAFIWARGNRERLGLENARIVFDDLARALPELDGTVSVVVSNPPYIPAAAVPRDPEVRLFDPPSALYGGEDGLDVVRSLSATALRLLRSGGVLVMEHGELQGADIRALLTADGWRGATTQRDLTGRDRATVAVR